jgi:hypothetical protein
MDGPQHSGTESMDFDAKRRARLRMIRLAVLWVLVICLSVYVYFSARDHVRQHAGPERVEHSID